ncbi:hypothetical protein MUN88_16480 [Gracilibacillus caseinilyticus]|uniref:Uncharacterized protein n=1 Tax=Gracilibacillus caseinilyticus TaxID=2932256 RepID=A0ABY4ETU8_9BACI|nr:hypothetical protein [Gracilibacillus caseinilyticus]UOQ47638.1 hypothetical protein MUN88_16480 [Gracilibacillus caseinilyticus]
MEWKKYVILLIPFVIAGLILIYVLPRSDSQYSLLTAIILWIVYYVWIYKNKKEKDNN